VSTDAVSTDAVSTDAVSTDVVSTDAVSTELVGTESPPSIRTAGRAGSAGRKDLTREELPWTCPTG
jgi:hypothetical protein